MVKIVAETREEFDRLEGLAKKLFGKVIIEGVGLIVQDGVLDMINIFPDKMGEIKRIYTTDGKSCSMTDVTPEYIVLLLDNQEYKIGYKPKE